MKNLCLSDTNKKICDENKNWKMMTEKLKSSPIISSESLKTENENKEIIYLKKTIKKFTEG